MKTDPRIDAYIAKTAPFAQPILEHLRELVHRACPEGEETMKWSMPHFMYQGMLCGMATFKGHCSFGFWKAKLLFDDQPEEEGMGTFGKITKLADLPSDETLIAYLLAAMKLNEDGVSVPKEPKPRRKEIEMPGELQAGLRRNAAARATFEGLSPSGKREYVEWICEAKRPETREKRLQTTLAWLAEGKRRDWKYENC